MTSLPTLLTQDFAYASGRTGVLQQMLLSQSDVDRLLGCENLDDAQKILTELKMTSIIDQGISDWHEILEAIGAWIRNEVEQMSPLAKRPTFHILWLENDAAILSYLLKKQTGLTSSISQEPISSMTAYGAKAMSALIEEGSAGTLPEHLVTFVSEVKANEKLTAIEIDAAVANFIFRTQLRLAHTSGSSDVVRFVEHRIAINNARTTRRGGSDLIDIQTDKISLESSDEDENVFEQSASRLIAEDITRMWNVPLSIEPLFAFAAIGMSQIKVLRVLLIGKGNDLSPQEIKQVLPPFLSASHYLTS